MRVNQDGSYRYDRYAVPEEVTQEEKDLARKIKFRLEELLRPEKNPDWIRGRVAVMKCEYYVDRTLNKAMIQEVAQNWVRQLYDFPQWAIDKAIIEAQRNKEKGAPNSGDVYREANKQISKYVSMKIICEAIERRPLIEKEPEISPEEKAERKRKNLEYSKMVKSALKSGKALKV